MSDIISGLDARMVLDSRGNPTVEVDCYVGGSLLGRAMVPSGASTGAHEAIELRDGDSSRWLGKGVDSAVNNVVEAIQEALVGMPVDDQKAIDEVMIELDGTPNKANLGANAMLGVSMACLHAGAALHELPLWRYVGGVAGGLMPVPMLNILNGGAHAASNVDVQEFMVMPHGFDTFPEALRAGVECYHSLKRELKADGLLGGVGDEGGFAPNLPANEAGLGYMVRAIEVQATAQKKLESPWMLLLQNSTKMEHITWMARNCLVRNCQIFTHHGLTNILYFLSKMDSQKTTGEVGHIACAILVTEYNW